MFISGDTILLIKSIMSKNIETLDHISFIFVTYSFGRMTHASVGFAVFKLHKQPVGVDMHVEANMLISFEAFMSS